MCGFVGYLGKSLEKFSDALPKAARSIVHRGPDGTSRKTGDLYDVAFNRLSINDLSDAAMQPFEYEGVICWVNGEVYNHVELKRKYIEVENILSLPMPKAMKMNKNF